MNRSDIAREFETFMEFPSDSKDHVTSASAKLFAEHCVQKVIVQQAAENERLKQQLECEMDITKQVQQERDELKAYQISLRSFLIWARDEGATERDFDLALSETPAQSLAEIKIQAAVEDALSLHQQAYGVTEYVNAHDLRQYANQLRNQKEGE